VDPSQYIFFSHLLNKRKEYKARKNIAYKEGEPFTKCEAFVMAVIQETNSCNTGEWYMGEEGSV
jgi:hypothetical protein